jgi:hypothetical protein
MPRPFQRHEARRLQPLRLASLPIPTLEITAKPEAVATVEAAGAALSVVTIFGAVVAAVAAIWRR